MDVIRLVLCILASGLSPFQGAPLTPLPVREPVPIDLPAFLDGLSAGQSGYRKYESRTVTLADRRFERALVTEVANIRPGEQLSKLSVLLNGDFVRFRATVGREEREASRGRGYVYFEVWGDDRLLARTEATGALRSPVGIGTAEEPTRREPTELDVSTEGVLSLTLITRYASDLPQRGRDMDRARGCVWGNARLTPRPGYVGNRAGDPLRDALRLASARLIAGALAMSKADAPGLRMPPYRIGVAPLRQVGGSREGTVPEPVVRAVLEELLLAAQQGRGELFKSVDRKGARLLTEAFRPDRPEREEGPELTEVGRKAGATLVVTGSYTGGVGGRVLLMMWDTRTGRKYPSAEVTIASLRPTSSVVK
ncbi:MAG: NPCBM/NEW2 domain-containing protein [Capsulimonadales bacterium]|nr:NPCBM/NEW2 domain-containing protein [Capsulimonadales bacterium]